MRTRSDRRRDNRIWFARAKVVNAEAATHCACFGVIGGKPSFAVKPADCGHHLQVARERVERGLTIDRQIAIPTKRANPIRNIAVGLNVKATKERSQKHIRNRPYPKRASVNTSANPSAR